MTSQAQQNAAEMMRRINIAAAYVADMPCECELFESVGHQTFCRECRKHYLERVLAGDE